MTPECAEFGHDLIFQRHPDIVDARSYGTHDFGRRRDQMIAELGRLQVRDAAMRGNRPFIVGIAGKRKSRIGEGENRAAMGNGRGR